MRALIIVFALMVSACSNDSQVTPRHVAKATEECASHGGLKVVSSASQTDERLSCGRYCDRRTGRTQLNSKFICIDGATYDLIWFE